MKNYVFDFAWGVTQTSNQLSKDKGKDTRIFITRDPNLKGNQFDSREKWKESVHLYYSDDFFKTEEGLWDKGHTIIMTEHYCFIARAIAHDTINIFVSRAEEGFLDLR